MVKSVFEIEEEIKKFDKLWSPGSFVGAIDTMARILEDVLNLQIPKRIEDEIKSRIRIIESTDDKTLNSITAELFSRYDRLNEFISFGENYDDYDSILLITHYDEIKTVQDFLLSKKLLVSPAIDLKEIEQEILDIGKSKMHQKKFRQTISRIKNQ